MLSIKTNDLHFLYLGAFMYGILVIFLNMYPMNFKSRVMKSGSGNMRANMFIYQLAVQDGSKSVVTLCEDGDVGLYNRSNRALYHFIENSSNILLFLIVDSMVFPVPTFVCFCIIFIGRMWYTIGYTNGGYGGHVKGFMLIMLSMITMSGMCLLTAIKGFQDVVVPEVVKSQE